MQMKKSIACIVITVATISSVGNVSAESCGPPFEVIRKNEFFVPQRLGRLALLKSGPDSPIYYMLGACTTIYMPPSSRLNFQVSNVAADTKDVGVATYLGVQIAKSQSFDKNSVVTIERNENWARASAPQKPIPQSQINGISVAGFVDLHSRLPFNDSPLRYGQWWWHATPNGTETSSNSDPKKWVWRPPVSKIQSDKLLLSNRLYRFELSNGKDSKGIPFFTDLHDGGIVIVRVFSPRWPDNVGTYEIRVRNH